MGDLQRIIEAKLRITKEGDAEIFGKSADEIENLQRAAKEADAAGAGLGKAYEKASELVAAGSAKAKGPVEALKVAIDNYRRAIEEAEKAGAHVGEAQRKQLADLEDQWEKATKRVGEFEVSEKKAQRATEDAVKAAGGQVASINSLDDVVKELADDLGQGAVKWLSWGTAAVGAFTAGYSAGEKFRKMVNEATGGELDRLIQKYNPIIALVNQWGEATAKAGEQQRVANEQHVLAAHNIDTHGKSVAEIDKLYADYIAKVNAARAATEAHTAATKAATAALEAQIDVEGAHADALARTNAELAAQAEAAQKVAEANAAIEQSVKDGIASAEAASEAWRKLNATLGQVEAGAKQAAEALAKAAAAAGHDAFGNPTQGGYGAPSGSIFPGGTGTGAYAPTGGGG